MKTENFRCWIILTVSTVGSSRPRFLRGTSDEESWEDDGVEAGPPLILTAVDLSANGVEARLSESFPPLSDLRVLVAFLFFLQRIKIVQNNCLKHKLKYSGYKMEAAYSTKTLVPIYKTAEHQNTEDHYLITHNCENLKSYMTTLVNRVAQKSVN